MSEELVVVFAGGSVKAGMVRSLLESDGLTAFLEDENIGLMKPWVIGGTSLGAVKVVVPHSQAQRAREVMGAAGM